MKKPSKEEIINGIQFFLMIYTMGMGFWFSYMLIWIKIGLPTEWLAFLVTMFFAFLSLFGLMQWIRNS
jgi:hypothetical protein